MESIIKTTTSLFISLKLVNKPLAGSHKSSKDILSLVETGTYSNCLLNMNSKKSHLYSN